MAMPNRPKQILASLKWWLLIAALFSFTMNILVMISPLYSFQVFDRVLSSSHLETLLYLTLGAIFGFFVMSLLDGLRSSLLARIGSRFEREIAPELVKVAVDTATSPKPVGIQPLRDLGQIRNFVGGPLIAPLFDAPWMPFFTIILWCVHPLLGILTVVSAAILFGLALLNHRMQRIPSQSAAMHLASAYRLAEAAVRHGESVQAMGLFPNIMARWRASAEGALLVQEKAADRGALINSISKFVRLVAQILILGLGAYLVLTGQMTGGGMIAGSMLLGRALMPVEQSIAAWRQFISARQAYQSIVAALESHQRPAGQTSLPPPNGQIELERVVYQPNPSFPPVIKGVSMTVNAGEMLGVIGPSASGKTTICKLMIGILKPTAGYVRMDGADLKLWNHEDLGRYLGYLLQTVELFTGTIADNIARMGFAEPSAVVAAAQLAGVHDLILRLPAGYDTPVGEGGVQLSGGQRQRIGLARALYGNPKVLLLDEPNANLDAEGENVLIQSLERLKRTGTTIIVVAHRPQILKPADRLLVVKDGQIAMLGPKDQVLAALSGAPGPAAAQPGAQAPRPQPQHGPIPQPQVVPQPGPGPAQPVRPPVPANDGYGPNGSAAAGYPASPAAGPTAGQAASPIGMPQMQGGQAGPGPMTAPPASAPQQPIFPQAIPQMAQQPVPAPGMSPMPQQSWAQQMPPQMPQAIQVPPAGPGMGMGMQPAASAAPGPGNGAATGSMNGAASPAIGVGPFANRGDTAAPGPVLHVQGGLQ